MTNYGRHIAKEHQIWSFHDKSQRMNSSELRCAIRGGISFSTENGGGSRKIEKFRCYLSWACQQSFEVSKCAILTLLPLSSDILFKQ